MYNRFKDEIKWRRFVWMIITSKRFRSHLKGLIFYALINYEENRGDNASDALLFDTYYGEMVIKTNRFDGLPE